MESRETGQNSNLFQVREFWESNPLFLGEFEHKEFSAEFFAAHEQVIIEDSFAGKIDERYFSLPAGIKVLDIGCGPGFWVRQFSKRGFEPIAVDLTRRAVGLTRASLAPLGYHARLAVADAEALPFQEGSFDHVNCQGVIHHAPNTEKCIQEFYRVLKEGGTVSFSVYYKVFTLRNKSLFRLVQWLGRFLSIGLKGRGRENFVTKAASPEEVVRMYDGAENPIGRAYTKSEVLQMASPYFEIYDTHRHNFPARAFPVKIPRFIHRALHRYCGLMFVVYGKKRARP